MISFRLALEKDIQELSQLSAQLGYPCSVQDTLRFFKDLNKDPNHAVYVAENEDGRVTGYIHVFKTKRLFLSSFAELGGLVVEEYSRSAGVGKELLNRAESWAKSQGCREIRIRSNVIREQAHEFYQNQGYQGQKDQTVFLKEI